jgi:TolA-binding protein
MRRAVRHWLSSAVVLLVVAWVAVPAGADQALDDYNLGLQLFKQGRWAQAADIFRKFLRDHGEHPRAPLAKLHLGLALLNQSEFKSAREVLRQFVKEHPEDPNVAQARFRVAECSYLLNELPAAKTELEAYLKDHPDDPFAARALPYLGDVQLRLNDAAAAEQTFAKAVERFPEGPLVDDARFGWAKALEAQNQHEAALARYRELAKGTGPRAADAQLQIGLRQVEQQQYAEAATTFRELAQRFPQSPLAVEARLNAGNALYRAGQFAEAAREFAQAEAVPAHAVTAGYWRGRSLKEAGDYARAADLFKSLAAKAAQHPLAETILYQQGTCERLAGRGTAARKSFLEVVARFPQGDLADDALHCAAELAIEAGDLAAAEELLKQFAQNYPESGLRMYQELLKGRLALVRASKAGDAAAAEADYAIAAAHCEQVLNHSTRPQTRAQARYYLALTRQMQGQHPQALETLAPLIAELESLPELVDALVLQADSWLHVDQPESAVTALERYFTLAPKGRQLGRALSLGVQAHAKLGQTSAAQTMLERLAREFPKSPAHLNALLHLAEAADARQDWPAAERLYRQLLGLAEDGEHKLFALRGLGFVLHRQKEFAAASELFAEIGRTFGAHRLAAEAAYYHAECLREAGQLAEAAAAFAAAFERRAPMTPAATGEEQRPPFVFVYRAGLQAARTWRRLGNVPEAHQAYAALLEKFPRPEQLDRVLDEWAMLNYEAERFSEADALFRRLLAETPHSELADNARLNLAESDLLAGKLDEARAQFEALLASDQSDNEVRERSQFQLVVLSLEQRRWSEVRERAERFLKEYPDSADRNYMQYCGWEARLAEPQSPPQDLEALRKELQARIEAEAPSPVPSWWPRLWVLLAEAQFRLKDYDALPQTLADLKQRFPQAPQVYQVEEVLGRGFKQQARFDEARQAFERVLAHPAAFRTETAAKAQFLIGETYLLEEKWSDAFLAYQKVYVSYKFPEWQAEALLQAGKCDEQLGQWADAVKTYTQMLEEFPQSSRAAEARKRLDSARKRAAAN